MSRANVRCLRPRQVNDMSAAAALRPVAFNIRLPSEHRATDYSSCHLGKVTVGSLASITGLSADSRHIHYRCRTSYDMRIIGVYQKTEVRDVCCTACWVGYWGLDLKVINDKVTDTVGCHLIMSGLCSRHTTYVTSGVTCQHHQL